MCTSWILVTLFLFHEPPPTTNFKCTNIQKKMKEKKNPYPFSDVTPTRSCHDLKHHHFHHPTSTTNQRQSRHRNETNWKSKKRRRTKKKKSLQEKEKKFIEVNKWKASFWKELTTTRTTRTTRTTTRIKRLKNKKKQKLCIGTPCSHLQLTWTILVSSVTPAKLIRLGHNLPVVSPVPSIPNLFRPKEWTSDMPTVGGGRGEG